MVVYANIPTMTMYSRLTVPQKASYFGGRTRLYQRETQSAAEAEKG